ncbi:unnamed protein product [Phytomonas sp. EM1]|nr:unnamed protein product [Phytomonas sp. EM1]|eukprot:CCW60282.1 unnamed protein product [Phytomonas sp. isolate EM1]
MNRHHNSVSMTGNGTNTNGEQQRFPIEVASMFYTGLNEPKPTCMDFSLEGLSFISSHNDDALRLIDVASLNHTETIQCEHFGIHSVRYTQSESVVCVAPRLPLDGHLHLLNLETAQFFGEMAYLNELDSEIHPYPNTPVYSTISQCPATDVLGAVVTTKGRLALFHPLISGAIAASGEKAVIGSKVALSFSHDGNRIIIGDDRRINLFDRRVLFSTPIVSLENQKIFSSSPELARCKGAEHCIDQSHLLLTSSSGEVVVYNWKLDRIVCSYYHGDAKRHFVGSSDAIGAKYIHPNLRNSIIAQPTSSMVGGRHLLVYGGYEGNESGSIGEEEVIKGDFQSEMKSGLLRYELQSKDSDVPIALAVNPRYSLVVTAARSLTWWAFNE